MAHIRRLAALAVAAATACSAGDVRRPPTAGGSPVTADTGDAGAPTPASEPAPAPAAASTGGGDGARCRDYTDLDPATLPPLPDGPYTAMFEAAWDVVRTKHFDPTLGCLDWPALRLRYGARAARAKSPAEAYEAVRALLAHLGQSHFALVADDEPGAKGRGHVPFSVRWIEDAPVVVHSQVPAVPAGSLVEHLGGADPAAEARRAAARHGVGTRAFRIRRRLDEIASCTPDAKVPVTIRPPGAGAARQVRVRCRAPVGETVSLGHLRNVPTRVEARMLPGTHTGYLAFNVWMLPMVPRIQAAVADLRRRGATSMILDLRGNPGGVGAMSVPVARLFLREGGSLGTLRFRTFEQTFQVAPNPDAFDGPVAILVDEGTASTSEIFATGMQALGRAVVVGGRPSAGAALPSLIESLPGGARLQFVVGAYQAPDGRPAPEGTGVVPDVRVVERIDAFAEGRDPVLEAAVDAVTRAAKVSSEAKAAAPTDRKVGAP